MKKEVEYVCAILDQSYLFIMHTHESHGINLLI